MSTSPFFIIGTERSGSNLLRLLLNAHSRIVVPHPPHILRYFRQVESGYGPLEDPGNFRRLARDVKRLVQLHIYPWDHELDLERMAAASPRNLLSIYCSVYEQAREHAGKARWGCKSTFMIDEVEAVRAQLPGAKFLYLVRDPRDVAASSKESVFNPFHPYYTARLWRAQQLQGRRWLDTLPADAITLITYEALVAQPEAEVKRICAFLGEQYEPAMLRYFEGAEAKKSSRLSTSWARTGEQVRSDHSGAWRKRLTADEIRIVEAVALDAMEKFGYRPDNPPEALADPELARERPSYRLLDAALRARTEVRSLFKDRNHWRRWARGVYVAQLRWRHGRKADSNG